MRNRPGAPTQAAAEPGETARLSPWPLALRCVRVPGAAQCRRAPRLCSCAGRCSMRTCRPLISCSRVAARAVACAVGADKYAYLELRIKSRSPPYCYAKTQCALQLCGPAMPNIFLCSGITAHVLLQRRWPSMACLRQKHDVHMQLATGKHYRMRTMVHLAKQGHRDSRVNCLCSNLMNRRSQDCDCC